MTVWLVMTYNSSGIPKVHGLFADSETARQRCEEMMKLHTRRELHVTHWMTTDGFGYEWDRGAITCIPYEVEQQGRLDG